MIVTLDGNRVAAACSPAATLQNLVDQVAGTLSSERLVVAVSRDGEDLLNARLEAALQEPLDNGMQVDLTTADRRELAATALRHLSREIARIGEQQAKIAAQLNAGQTEQALQRFAPFLEVWQTSQRSLLHCCQIVGADLTLREFEGQAVSAHLAALADKLRELRQAFKAADMVLLADLLEYELPPLCRHWCNLMASLADGVRAAPAETHESPAKATSHGKHV